MTSDDPTPDARPDRPAAGNDFPDWLRQLEQEIQPSRWVRLRIRLHRVGGGLLAVVGALLVCGLLVTAGTVAYRHARRPGSSAYPTAGPSAGVGADPTASPTTAAGAFAGTPAAAFPQGVAGIILPAAEPTGAFTAKQVAAGLAKVRAAMVTARLDRAFMTAKDPERLVRQFAPEDRDYLRWEFGTERWPTYATRLAPDARLAPDQPRVKGTVTYRATREPDGARVLEVTTNFVWAYAFARPGAAPGAGVAVLHDTLVWHLPHPDDVRPGSKGLRLWSNKAYGWNLDCALIRQGLLDAGRPDYTSAGTTEDPDQLYDPNHPIAVKDHC
ncbi:hypothetical protein [Micromonospora sp. RTP1Z1]|uniref:hypothetical protein n=1 Tax=Micromonospora sp. RTP1Z1 TaxID=2994043 RepID=UPI0029C655BD|nr:hypothetical protein [Micromonospora sp. RTP1Z1]